MTFSIKKNRFISTYKPQIDTFINTFIDKFGALFFDNVFCQDALLYLKKNKRVRIVYSIKFLLLFSM